MSRGITVIGRGLIGREVRGRGEVARGPEGLPWNDLDALASRFRNLVGELDERLSPQTVVWTAGRSVIASSEEECRQEVDAFRSLLDALAMSRRPERHTVVLASSIGGLFAGSPTGVVIDERTEVRPTSAYGRAKLLQEELLRDLCARTGVRSVLARIATAYGPGQDRDKPQGLVSALIAALRDRRPLRIFVPLDTRRSFLWAEDVGLILAWLATNDPPEAGDARVRMVAGSRSASLIELLAIVHRVTGRRPPVLIGRSPERRFHATHLDVRPGWRLPVRLTPLEVGVARCWSSSVSRSVA